ncbi:MAG: 50S ribosomal protein L11 [Actinomycetota bacterium]|nr:50S ribosomal protein L11 [Actinomycetota bacterium]
MAKKKKVASVVKLQLPAGQATPAPPVGTALGPTGIAIMDFCRAYNEKTAAQQGTIIPVVVTIYDDRTFDFVLKSPPAATLLKQAANTEKGSAEPHRVKVGTVTREQLREIAQTKMADLNAVDIDQAAKIIEGTARSMGINVA